MTKVAKKYAVVILAGYAQSPTPLALETGELCKALLPIKGRPMLSYVVDALHESGCMRRLVLVGLGEEDGAGLRLNCPLVYLPNQHSMIENVLAAIDVLDGKERVLLCSTDLPLLTAEAIRDFLSRAEAGEADLCYPIVCQEVMEARFPDSGRSFRNLVDGAFAGGDLFLVAPEVIRNNADFARALSDNRKEAWGLAKAMGPGVILRFLVRRLHIRDLEKRAAKILHCSCKAIISPYAELAMDVDKPQHLAVVLEAMGED